MRRFLLVIMFPFVLGLSTPAHAQEEAAPQSDWMVHIDHSTGSWRFLPDRIILVPGGTVQLMVFGNGKFSLTLDDASRDAEIPTETGSIRTAEFAAPAEPGEYPFHDKYHPEARGVLIVRESASEPAPPLPVIGVIPGGYESQFSPREIRVAPGAEVAFKANGTFGHNLQAVDGTFSAGDLRAGEESTFVAPQAPGEYAFECRFHMDLGMVGVLIVEEGAPGSPPARDGAPESANVTQVAPTAGTDEIVLIDNEIVPKVLNATRGSPITVRNAGATPHTLTAQDGSFDTGRIEPGASTTITLPDRLGAVHIYCRYHAAPDSRPEDAMAADIQLQPRQELTPSGGAARGTPGLPLLAIFSGVAVAAFAFRHRSAP